MEKIKCPNCESKIAAARLTEPYILAKSNYNLDLVAMTADIEIEGNCPECGEYLRIELNNCKLIPSEIEIS